MSDEKVFVSVIMPSYNAEEYVGEAIESILNQSYEDFELIIVDDLSTDGTYSRIKQFKDDRIITVRNNENKGIAFSTNRGINMSKGKYIALIDDDDIAYPYRLKKQIEYMEENESIDILGGNSEIIDAQGNHIRYGKVPHNNPKYLKAMLLFKTVDFINDTAMIRSDFLRKYELRYKEKYCGMQDYRFFMDASKIGNISSIDNYIMKYRIHDHNYTDKCKQNYSTMRKRLYSQIRKDSLTRSGYMIADQHYGFLDAVLQEDYDGCINKHMLDNLYCVFVEILKQAVQMEVDYFEELNLFLKRLYTDKLYRTDLFNVYD